MDSMIACNMLETFRILLFVLVFNLFHRQQRRNRSHGHRSNSSRTSEITLDLLRNLYNGGQGHGNLHRLLTTLHSARLPNLHNYLLNVNN